MPGENSSGPGFTFDDDAPAAPKAATGFTFDEESAPAPKAPTGFSYDESAPKGPTGFTFDDEPAPTAVPAAEKPVSQMGDDEWRAKAEAEYGKSLPQKAVDFGTGALKGLKGAAGSVYDYGVRRAQRLMEPAVEAAIGQRTLSDALLETGKRVTGLNPKDIADVTEGAIRGTRNAVGLVGDIGGAAADLAEKAGNQWHPQDAETAKERWLQEWRARELEKEKAGQKLSQPLTPGAVSGVVGAKPDLEDANALAMGLDPSLVVPGAMAKLGLAGKTAAVAEKGSALGSAMQKGGRAISAAAHAPETLAGAVGGERVRHLVDHTISGAGGLSAITHGGLAENPLAAIAQVLTAGKAAGAAVTKAGEAVSAVAPKLDVVTAVPVFERVAKDVNAPMWVRQAAKTIYQDAPLLGSFIEGAASTGKAALHGAGVNAGLAAASGKNAEEIGEGAGTGFALAGGLHFAHGIGDTLGGSAKRQAADNMAFALKMQAQGTPNHVLAALHPDVVNQMATFDQMAGGSANFSLLDGKQYAVRAAQMGQAEGSAGFYDPSSKQIVVNAEAKRGPDSTFLHEAFGHAIYDSVVNKDQWKAHVDSTFGPQGFDVAANQYAEKLLQSKLRGAAEAKGLNPTAADIEKLYTPQDVTNLRGEIDQQQGGRQWVYDELFAEQAAHTLYGKNIREDVLRPSDASIDRSTGIADTSFIRRAVAAMFPPRMTDLIRSGAKPQMILEGFPQFDSPQGRKLLYQAIRDRNNTLIGLDKAGEAKDSAVVVNKDMAGNHPGLPMQYNPATGKFENDFFEAPNPSPFAPPKPGEQPPAGTKLQVTEKPKASVARTDRTRSMEVRDQITKGAALPPGSPETRVAPRVGEDGKTVVAGTEIAPQLANFQSFGPGVKANATTIDASIKNGETLHFYYQAIASGQEGKSYAADVRRNRGNKLVTERNAVPYSYEVSKANNVLVKVLDLTTAEKKAQAWADTGKLRDFNNSVGDFMSSVRQVLQNHAQGLPGDANGIGTFKKNQVNQFLAGDIKSARDYNPLRAEATGSDRQGIIRSFRLDRIASIDAPKLAPGQEIGGPVSFPKIRQNLSPDVTISREMAPRTGALPSAENGGRLQPDENVERGRAPMGSADTRGAGPGGTAAFLEAAGHSGDVSAIPKGPAGADSAAGQPKAPSPEVPRTSGLAQRETGAVLPAVGPDGTPPGGQVPKAIPAKGGDALRNLRLSPDATRDQAHEVATKARIALARALHFETPDALRFNQSGGDPLKGEFNSYRLPDRAAVESAASGVWTKVTRYATDPQNYQNDLAQLARKYKGRGGTTEEKSELNSITAARDLAKALPLIDPTDIINSPRLGDPNEYTSEGPAFNHNGEAVKVQHNNSSGVGSQEYQVAPTAAGGHVISIKGGAIHQIEVLSKIARQNDLSSGNPTEILGITDEGQIVTRQPLLEDTDINPDNWYAQNKGSVTYDSKLPTQAAPGNNIIDEGTHQQPILKGQSGNSYVGMDVRAANFARRCCAEPGSRTPHSEKSEPNSLESRNRSA